MSFGSFLFLISQADVLERILYDFYDNFSLKFPYLKKDEISTEKSAWEIKMRKELRIITMF